MLESPIKSGTFESRRRRNNADSDLRRNLRPSKHDRFWKWLITNIIDFEIKTGSNPVRATNLVEAGAARSLNPQQSTLNLFRCDRSRSFSIRPAPPSWSD